MGGLVSACGALSGLVPMVGRSQDVPEPDLNRVLPLKIADFPELLQEGGSVLVTYDGSTKLMINRGAAGKLYVMDPTCPHAGCQVDPYEAANQMIVCPCHGSSFAVDGELTGGPAERSLSPYPSRFSNGILQIELPEFEFGIQSISPVKTAAGAPRLALTFPTENGSAYRLHRGTDPGQPFALAPFSKTQEGALTFTEITGEGDPVTVYVDAAGPRHFFRLELLVFRVE
jgi:nitrite reductase/ring-hydroxylating ferredoxin subunit